ncbi:putative gem-associated protein 5 [Apostichopus japonicus]|uniref:Putative gem-associated protein 5 n=1 Tax=Stichopus japonicus TaxID=307972 RepID=A0A2G8LKT3_STIJA|nr:putative gem-associated protein 5 [Apostichopus japonicus]
MAFEGLPPSPNWYSSTASDTNQDGVLAYASRNSVSLLNISDDGQTLIGYLHGHEQRVAAVAFNKLDNQLLATCGDDCMVKVWNWHSKSVIKEHKSHESKVTCVSWNPSNKDVLTTGDDKGNIVSWNQSEDELKSWSQEKNPIACLAYSNTNEQYLAVGYKSGKIYVIDLSKKKPTVVLKLRGHDDEVQSMCWSPTSSQTANGSSLSDLGAETETLLLSGGKDQHIRLWSLSQDKMLHAFKLPAKGGAGQEIEVMMALLGLVCGFLYGGLTINLNSSYQAHLGNCFDFYM